MSPKLLRGRRLRSLARPAVAVRRGVGNSGGSTAARGQPDRRRGIPSGAAPLGGQQSTEAILRRRVGVDHEPLCRLSGLSPCSRSAGGGQREVHVQSDRVAGRSLRDAALSHPRDLSKLIPTRCTVAVYRDTTRGGRRGVNLFQLIEPPPEK